MASSWETWDSVSTVNGDGGKDGQALSLSIDWSWPTNLPPVHSEESHTLPVEPDSEPVEPLPPPNRSIYPLQTRPGWRVVVEPYNPEWPKQYARIAAHLSNLFDTSTPPVAYNSIEHIGSTSIPSISAKPNIDVLVTLPNQSALELAIDALTWEIPTAPPYIRYTQVPRGGGIQGRESFKLYLTDSSPYFLETPERSVYLISEHQDNWQGRVQIRCYRSVRETLRKPQNKDLLKEYEMVKLELGQKIFQNSIEYSALKDNVVRKVLRRAGWTEEEVDVEEMLSKREFKVEKEEPPY